MKHSNLLMFIFFVSIVYFTPETHAQVERAKRYVKKDKFYKAIDQYEKAWKKNQFSEEIIRELGKLYLQTNNYRGAETWFRKLYENGYSRKIDLYHYCKILQYNGKHNRMLKLLSKEENNGGVLQMYFPKGPELKDLRKKKSGIKIKPVNFNTLHNSEMNPSYFGDDKLVFMSNKKSSLMVDRIDSRSLKSYYNLYVISKPSVGYSFEDEPENFSKSMKYSFNYGPLCIGEDSTEIFYSKNIKGKSYMERNTRQLKIYSAQLTDKGIEESTLLPFNEPGYSFSHPSLSSDGNILYFVSDMPGGFGGTDIYKARKIDGVWSDIENLGSNVNTWDNEISPYATKKGNLIFASRGLAGLGGYDLFFYSPADTIGPKNFGAPINSIKDDFGLCMDEREGYFTSNRQAAVNDDIYYFYTSEILERIENTSKTDEIDLPKNSISADGLILKVGDDLSKLLDLKPIYFEFNSDRLTDSSKVELDYVINLLNAHTTIEIELRAHTDSRGPDWYNQKLSERRAKSALDYISSRIIAPLRVTSKGFGESQLLNNCGNGAKCTEEEHAKNRRVEFIIMKIK